MKTLLILIPFLLGSVLSADLLIETRFGDQERLVPVENTADGRITGVLPDTVLEDSAWSGIGVEYRFEEDALGGGLGWIEARLQGGDRGQAQLKWLLPELTEPGRYRLDVLLAGADNAAVTFAVRSTSPPYTAHWEHTVTPGAYRQSHSLDFALPAVEGDVALIAHMGRRGTLFFYNLSLSRRGEADLAAERAERLAAAPANLLPAAGFALGLPSGWSTGAQLSRLHDVRVEPAAAEGPRGTVPLRLAARRGGSSVTLASAPFEPLLRDEPHTARFFLRGTVRDGSLAVQVDDRTLASTLLPSSPDEWTEVSLTFTPDLTAPWHVLTWTLDGEIEIDTLTLRVDADGTPAERPPEVALSGHPMRNYVFLRGENQEVIAFAVTGAEPGDILQLTAHDLRGRTADLPPQTLEDTALVRGTVSFKDIFTAHPYGPLRIEGRLLRDGEPVSPPVERVIHRLRVPRYWGHRAPQSRFGTHINLFEPHLHSMKAIGINWVRLHGPNGRFVYWSGVEPRQGEWRFHRDAIQQYLDAGLEIVGSWLHTPGWARIERQTHDGWLDNWWQPRDYDEFAEYVRRVTAAHADQITHWQIWNEPWGDFWIGAWRPELGPRNQWHAGDTPAEDFARLSRIAYASGKSVNPDIRVLGVNATVGERGKHWMRRMLDLDVERYSDIITFHAYTGGGLRGILGSQAESLPQRLNARILEPLQNKPGSLDRRGLWLTEGTALQRAPDTGLLYHTVNGNVDDPALLLETRQALVVYHLLNFSKGVDKIFNYAPNATGTFFRRYSGIYWGALAHPGGELTPAAAAFSAMAWHLEATDFIRHDITPAGIHRFIFQRKDQSETLAALVAPDALPRPVRLPEDPTLRFEDLFGNPASGTETTFAELVWVVSPASPESLIQALDPILP
ncbi:MAG: hypothetical protein JJU05_18505 [Verrucomicrobia bacterium]|nr:hypothetical protein [Verrucomicrobiota bacterium]MCH8526552.1 hypothetical protein [Kiritimatiellia bacterium]